MSEEIYEIKKILISDDTEQKIKDKLIEMLKKEENVELVVVPAGSIHEQKMLQHIASKGSCVIVSEPKEETPEIQKAICKSIIERENETKKMAEKVKEQYEELIKNIDQYAPQCISPSKEYNSLRKKYNVPRTIGKPNSTRKGGR